MLYNSVMVFAAHQYESATGIHVYTRILSPPPTCLPPHPILPGCHWALALGALLHTSNLHLNIYLSYTKKATFLGTQCFPNLFFLEALPHVLQTCCKRRFRV